MSDFVWLIPDAVPVPAAPTGGIDAPAALAPIDHVAAGLNRLPWEWRDKVNMLAVFTVFLARYNALEQAFQDLLLLRSIDTANADDPSGTVGAQLDQIGAKVGQARNGLNNTDYRRYVRARIATNNSNGLVEDLITVAVLIINDPAAIVRVETQAVATSVVTIVGIAVDDGLATILINFLRVAVAGGYRLVLQTPSVAPARVFTLGDAGAPSSSALTGLGDSGEANQPTLAPYGTTGATGGRLSDVRE